MGVTSAARRCPYLPNRIPIETDVARVAATRSASRILTGSFVYVWIVWRDRSLMKTPAKSLSPLVSRCNPCNLWTIPTFAAAMYSRDQLAGDFRKLGVSPADTIMLHASVRTVGPIAGGPDQIHLALKDALTPEGTLMMYAGCPQPTDEVGRGHLTAEEEQELMDKLPAFDPLTARSDRDNGTLVEFLRTYPGTLVNRHVARFAVWGRRAADLISSQPWDYAYGKDSALDRFVDLGGRVLLLGCDHDTVTFLHYAEHIADIPGKRVATFKVPVADNGTRVWKEMKEFDTSGAGAHPNWPDRFFARIVDTYLDQTNNAGGLVGTAQAFLLDSRGLLDFALPVMQAVAADAGAAEELLEG